METRNYYINIVSDWNEYICISRLDFVVSGLTFRVNLPELVDNFKIALLNMVIIWLDELDFMTLELEGN